MKRRTFIKQTVGLAAAAGLPGISWAQTRFVVDPASLTHRVTDAKAPLVFFVPEVSQTAIIKAYDALKQSVKGEVGIKMTFETPGGPHLDPQLVKALAQHTKATLIDNNCFSPRDTTEKHLAVAKENGFDASIAPIDILDADGHMDLPVSKG